MRSTLRLRLEPDGLGAVEVDGKELPAVRGVQFSVEAGDRPQVMLDLSVFTVDGEGDDVEILLPEATVESLITLGWTPPPS